MTTATASAALLADGLTELAAAIDHDLRDRLRGVQREAEAWLVGNDPADDWPGFERWLGERAAREIADNHAALRRRATDLAAEAGVAVDIAIDPPDTPRADALLSPQRPAATELGLTTLRGACGGVITAGLLGNLAGLAVAAPAAVVVGLAFGVKTMRDDRARHLAVRRAEARAVVQRYVDEVVFQCANASRRSLREVQRRFRAAVAPAPTAAVAHGHAEHQADDRTVALAPLRRTIEHPPLAPAARREWRRPLALVAAAMIVAGIVAGLAVRDEERRATAAPATPLDPTSTEVAAPAAAADAGTFVAHLVAATRDGHTEALFERLHPAVVARYGADACRDYVHTVGAFPIDLTVRETGAAPAWAWVTDGLTQRIDDVVLVEVARVVNGQTVLQELHLARIDGSLRWFTDCGDPIGR